MYLVKMDATIQNGENLKYNLKKNRKQFTVLPGDVPIALWQDLGWSQNFLLKNADFSRKVVGTIRWNGFIPTLHTRIYKDYFLSMDYHDPGYIFRKKQYGPNKVVWR